MPDKIPRWLIYSIVAIVLYGVWGLVSTAASKEVPPLLIQVISTLGMVPIALALLFSKNLRQGKNLKAGMAYAFATGICGSTGNIALLQALTHGGEASTVFPLTGMYPLVTVFLARICLREKFNKVQAFGIVLALVAIWLFSLPSTGGASSAASESVNGWRKIFAPWLGYSLLTLLLYGVAAILQKFATNNISNELSTVFFALAFIPVAGVILIAAGPFDWNVSAGNWVLAILFGSLIAVGTLALFAAYRWGKASIVTALTALYPALTVVLAIPIFHESLNVLKGVAIVLALAGGVALSYEGKTDAAGQAKVA